MQMRWCTLIVGAFLWTTAGSMLLACSDGAGQSPGTATATASASADADPTETSAPEDPVQTPIPTAAAPTPSTAEIAANAVVRVDVLQRGQFVGNGSGTVIGDGRHVLTNYHVVAAGGAFQVVLEGNGGITTTAPAELVLFNETMDLAMLRLPEALGIPLELATAAPELGDPLLIAGYPGIGGTTLTVTRGTVSGFSDLGDGLGRVWIKTDATISFGNSGGAALDDDGRLVGVPTLGAGEGLGSIGYLIGSTAAADFVAAGLVSSGMPRAQGPIVTGDPFEFCALVGTVDHTLQDPNVRYVGPEVPFRDSLGWGLFWRCWDGKALVCSGGAAGYPCGIVDDSGIPSDWLVQHCRDNPNDPYPPMGAVGHMNAYDFACVSGEPTILGRLIEPEEVDSLGYLFGVWDLAVP